jgi:hypothetical protein
MQFADVLIKYILMLSKKASNIRGFSIRCCNYLISVFEHFQIFKLTRMF